MATISKIQVDIKKIISNGLKRSIFLWGPPGIGKSSILKKIAEDLQYDLIDLRISQLSPTDLRGLPYIDEDYMARKLARFAPQSFLPQDEESKGILFLDEFNMASPIMMGIAQQLILDYKIGEYEIPKGWYIIAAGNRAKDRAAVSQMPSPVANRFLHYTTEPDLASFKRYALTANFNEQILSFLNFRPDLLFSFNKSVDAWPSPRTWEYASDLINIDLEIDAAVGEGAAAEFYAYQSIYSKLPDIDAILSGEEIPTPTEPSLMYAVTGALVSRAKNATQYFNGFKWLRKGTTDDYTGLFLDDALVAMESKNQLAAFAKVMKGDEDSKAFRARYQELTKGF